MKTNFGFVYNKFDKQKITFYTELYKNIRYTCGFPSCCGANMHLNTAGKIREDVYLGAGPGILILEGEHSPPEKESENIVHAVIQTKNGPITVRVRQ